MDFVYYRELTVLTVNNFFVSVIDILLSVIIVPAFVIYAVVHGNILFAVILIVLYMLREPLLSLCKDCVCVYKDPDGNVVCGIKPNATNTGYFFTKIDNIRMGKVIDIAKTKQSDIFVDTNLLNGVYPIVLPKEPEIIEEMIENFYVGDEL